MRRVVKRNGQQTEGEHVCGWREIVVHHEVGRRIIEVELNVFGQSRVEVQNLSQVDAGNRGWLRRILWCAAKGKATNLPVGLSPVSMRRSSHDLSTYLGIDENGIWRQITMYKSGIFMKKFKRFAYLEQALLNLQLINLQFATSSHAVGIFCYEATRSASGAT